jgi:TRAP-type C4-dicarboxylate transport system permease small subunit
MVFIGSAALWRDREHFYVNLLETKLQTRRVGVYHLLFVEALSIIFLLLFLYYSFLFTSKAYATSPILRLPKTVWYVCMPISGVIMIGYSVRNIAHLISKIWQTRQSGSNLNSQTD